MFQLSNLLKSKISWLDGSGKHSDFVISCRIRLARNLVSHPFPGGIATAKGFLAVTEQTMEAAKKVRALARAAYVRLADLENVDRQFLVERHLISADLARTPQNRAVIIGDKELLSIMVNEEDHLLLQVLYSGLSLNEALQQGQALDQELGNHLPYAFHKEFGFLTSCPTNVGTGLRASCLVHLPALVQTQAIAGVLQELSRVGLMVRGFYGEGSKVYGDLFQISNATSIGKSEGEFAEIMTGILINVFGHETRMRQQMLRGEAKTKTMDRMWRAYGGLANCRLISYEETMQELSWVRMGLASGIPFDHLALAKVNEIIVLTQPAHIQMIAGRELTPGERDETRASLIRKTLQN